MLVDHRQFNYMYKRASYEVYKKFSINKMELWMLTCIEWQLMMVNKTVVAKTLLFGTITGNARERAKMHGYYMGLLDKGCIGTFEYISNPGSESVGLTDLGVSVLKTYEEAIKMFSDKFYKSPYRLSDNYPSFVEEPPMQHKRTA